jgi:anti-sigma regulatory factor (Ser/Thr protein kinase)
MGAEQRGGRAGAPLRTLRTAGPSEGRIVPGRVLPLDLRVLRRLRALVREDLLGAGVDLEIIDDAVICMHEACANAIRYGKGRLHVHWEVLDAEVRFGVCEDGEGPRLPDGEQPSTDQLSGRGLFLIGALSARLETSTHGNRNCLTFAFPRTVPPAIGLTTGATAAEEAS